LTGEEEQVGGFDVIYKSNKRVKHAEKKISMLGCLNDRNKNMRKLAFATALRLVEKHTDVLSILSQQAITSQKSKLMGPTNLDAPQPQGRGFSKSNRSATVNEGVKLPKLPCGSSKNIDPLKKNPEIVVKTGNSKVRGR
jgi:hypothetical protein